MTTKTKPIIADPLRLYALGLRNLMDMAVLVHVGRCGLIGARRRFIGEAMGVCYDTARSATDRLQELGLVTVASRDGSCGRAMNFVCTLRGWRLLTEPADFSLFPHSQLALDHEHTKKTRNSGSETAAGLGMGREGSSLGAPAAAAGALPECPPALGEASEGRKDGPRCREN